MLSTVRVVAILALATAVRGQDPAPADPVPDAGTATPHLAVKKFAAAGESYASVEVSVVKARTGFGGAVILNGGASRPPFQGTIEFWRLRGGAVVMATPRELDGAAIYVRDGVAYVTQTGVAGEASDVSGLANELPYLLDPHRIAEWTARADWKPTEREDGGTEFKATIKPRAAGLMAGGRGGMAAMVAMKGKVLRVDVAFTVAADGTLQHIEFAVVRNSAMSAMVAQGGVVQGLPGGIAVPKADEEAERTVYSVSLKQPKPSARLAEVRKHFEKLLADEEDE